MKRRLRFAIVALGVMALALALLASSAGAVTGTEVAGLTLRDALNRSEKPLSNGGKWSALHWATDSPQAGVDYTSGWSPYEIYPYIGGAYWATSFAQPAGASVKMPVSTGLENRHQAIWLDMSSPGTTESGYELSWTYKTATSYTLELSKWVSGTQTELASVSTAISEGSSLAISDEGSVVKAWIGSGGTFSSVLSATDSTYSSGYSGIEASGINGHLTEFKAGQFETPSAPTFTWTSPESPAANTKPDIAGSAQSGSTVKLYMNSSCSGPVLATGTAAAFASPGLPVSVGKGMTTNYYATATSSGGLVSPCSTTHGTYQNDASEILVEGSKLSDFSLLQQCVSGRITEVADPLGSGKTVMSFEPHPSDIASNKECGEGAAPTEDPRAWAVSKSAIPNETEFWLRARFMVPAGFPEFEQTSWVDMLEIYGAPFEGPSPWNFEMKPLTIEGEYLGDAFMHQRNETYGYDIPWYETLSTGKWEEVLLHEKFSEKGFVEEWFNGVQEKFFNPAREVWNPSGAPETTKLEMATRDFTNDGEANSVRIGQYRAEENFTPSPTYFEYVKVGKTKASVGA